MCGDPIAVLSDIHGNRRALEAVLAEIERRRILRLVNLGDSLYGPFDPRPVADRLVELRVPTVSGNEDRVLVLPDQAPRTAAAPLSRAARFTLARLDAEHLAWLRALPRTAVVGDSFLCHGAPSDDETYLLSAVVSGSLAVRPSVDVEALLEGITQPLVLCGHDHTPRALTVAGRLVVNPGSVGCPAYTHDVPAPHAVKNGSSHARFAVVTPVCGGFAAEWVAVPYDAAGAAAEARANGFADWGTWIATGRAA
jgi:predicted phosphodiesterase